MKVVILTVDDAKKTELSGAEKLLKSDLLVLISTKAKSEMPASVKEALEEVKAEVEYCKIDAASETDAAYAYYAGYHDAKNHDTYIVATDKTKVPKLASKSAKVYTAFKSIVSESDTSTAKKKTSSTSKKKTTSTSKKKTTTSKKKTTKKEDTVSELLESVSDGKLDTDKLLKVAKKVIKNAGK